MVGDEECVPSLGHVVGPCSDHFVHGLFFARAACTRPCSRYQLTALGMPGPEVVEGMALGRVTLSQVVRERPEVAGVAGDEGFERAARADRAKLAVIAYGDQFRPRGLHSRQQLADV